MKKILILICIVISFVGCELEDNNTTTDNQNDTIKLDPKNTYTLAARIYTMPSRAFYGKEVGSDISEAGTDILTNGMDNRAPGFCNYILPYASEEYSRLQALWNEFYRGIRACNYIIKNENEVNIDSNVKLKNYNEAHFYRALYYWILVETWSNIIYSKEDVESAFLPETKDNIYKAILSDLWTIKNKVPTSASNIQTITKPVVEAFLARIHLYNKSYDSAVYYADLVVKNTNFSLSNNFESIWNIKAQNSKEMIFCIDNSQYPDPLINYVNTLYATYTMQGLVVRDGGNQNHLMYETRVDNIANSGVSRSLQTGRGFARYFPTKFFIDLFNETKDQRFKASFRNTWYASNTSTISNWPSSILINNVATSVTASLVGKPVLKLGDTAVYFSKKPVALSQKVKLSNISNNYIHPQKGYIIVDINDMYNADGSINENQSNRIFLFPFSGKFMDSTRINLQDQYSKRNAPVIRISEMYLIAAEALMMKGKSTEAYDYLKTLANARAINQNGTDLLATYGINSGSNINIDFILDERARELGGEQQRWYDLKRTGKLIERVKKNNLDAKAIMEMHINRPIPNNALNSNDKIQQNPGY